MACQFVERYGWYVDLLGRFLMVIDSWISQLAELDRKNKNKRENKTAQLCYLF